jgi:catechol 2,3-dioxygenase-like lactoylglutathione lyase family enzyme
MLADRDAMATIAVKDLAAAKIFYQQKLGFSPTGAEGAGVVTLRSGKSTIVVYESQFAGTNKATSQLGGSGTKWTQSCEVLRRRVSPSSTMICPGSGAKATFTSSESSRPLGPDGNILHINNQ